MKLGADELYSLTPSMLPLTWSVAPPSNTEASLPGRLLVYRHVDAMCYISREGMLPELGDVGTTPASPKPAPVWKTSRVVVLAHSSSLLLCCAASLRLTFFAHIPYSTIFPPSGFVYHITALNYAGGEWGGWWENIVSVTSTTFSFSAFLLFRSQRRF